MVFRKKKKESEAQTQPPQSVVVLASEAPPQTQPQTQPQDSQPQQAAQAYTNCDAYRYVIAKLVEAIEGTAGDRKEIKALTEVIKYLIGYV